MRKVLLVGLYKENESMNDFYKFIDSIQSFAIPIIEGEETLLSPSSTSEFSGSVPSSTPPLLQIENSKFIYIETPSSLTPEFSVSASSETPLRLQTPSSSSDISASETPPRLQKNKYDRFDKKLIENIESNELNNYFFYCYDIDERFTNTKYYNIETKNYEWRNKQIINETLTIKYDDIVDDLYYKRYIYES